MKVFVDTNVLLDVILKRHPFYEDSFAIFELADLECIRCYLSAASVTDIFYFVRKGGFGFEDTYKIIEELTALFSVAPVSETTIAGALALRWKDFEDAVQFTVAKENSADFIITRNKADYEGSVIPCISPANFIAYVNGDMI